MSVRSGNRFRTHWTSERIIAAILRWIEIHGEIPRQSDWDADRCRRNGRVLEAAAAQWYEREREASSGEWPTVKTVRERFGRWANAILAAGQVPRVMGQRTKRRTVPTSILILVGRAMRDCYEAEHDRDLPLLARRLRALAAAATEVAKVIETEGVLADT